MYRRSLLQPISRTGVCGQNCRISGSHIALQLRREPWFDNEKHRSTTSDLEINTRIGYFVWFFVRSHLSIFGEVLTFHMQNVCLSRGHQMYPISEVIHSLRLLLPTIFPEPSQWNLQIIHHTRTRTSDVLLHPKILEPQFQIRVFPTAVEGKQNTQLRKKLGEDFKIGKYR